MKTQPMDRRHHIKQQERVVRPPRLEGVVKNVGINPVRKRKQERRVSAKVLATLLYQPEMDTDTSSPP